MACAASSTAIFSPTPAARVRVRVSSSFPKSPSSMAAASFPSLSQTLTIPSNFNPLRHSFPRSFSLQRSCSSKRTFVVGDGELPLVGNAAPDFEAEAVFDQEFINVLSDDEKRSVYDRYGEAGLKGGGASDFGSPFASTRFI